MKATKKRVLNLFTEVIPNMSDDEIERLIAFGEGMIFMKKRITKKGQEQEGKQA